MEKDIGTPPGTGTYRFPDKAKNAIFLICNALLGLYMMIKETAQ